MNLSDLEFRLISEKVLNDFSKRISEFLKFLLGILIVFLVIVSFLIYLSVFKTGYIKENGQWIYVTYNAAGKNVKQLNVDNSTFSILNDKYYAMDKNKVFYKGSVIEDAIPMTFEVINNDGYSKDSTNVYVDWYKIINADPKTFIYLEYPYSKDDKNVYCGTLPMFVKNIQEFTVTERGSAKNTADINYFLKSNPDYTFIDTQKYQTVVYGDGKGETKEQKFEGYKLVQ